MKKKIIAISLITVMVICNSMTVWAADTWNGTYKLGMEEDDPGTAEDESVNPKADSGDRVDNNSGVKDVTSNFEIVGAGESYCVEIYWGSMQFTAVPTSGKLTAVWNSDIAEYTVTNHTGSWSNDTGANLITVVNKSNVDITAKFNPVIDQENFVSKYIDTSKNPNPTLNVDWSQFDVDCILNSQYNSHQNAVRVNAVINKAPSDNVGAVKNITLGTVTVSLSKKGS